MRLLFRLSYFGEGFHGLVRQPGLRTVEGELLGKLEELGIKWSRSIVSSRTDKGVSALTNYIAVDVSKVPPLGAFFDIPDLFVLGYVKVRDDFDPRRETRLRHYRYVFPEKLDLEKARDAAKLFEGVHDFVSFCIPEGKRTVREVKRINVFSAGGVAFMDVWARSFLRQQVRRMAYAIYMVGLGEWEICEVQRRLETRDPVPPLPPEYLLLVDVKLPLHVPMDERARERWKEAWIERERAFRARRVLYSTFYQFLGP